MMAELEISGMPIPYYVALMDVTGPTALTQFSRLDERWDVPMIKDDARRQFYESWLQSVGGPAEKEWQNIKKNWISFLSATSTRPNAKLAPNPSALERPDGQSMKEYYDLRFQDDRRVRAAIQVACYTVFDDLERSAERWPREARLILNRSCRPSTAEPFQTLRARLDYAKRRRYQGIWAGLICFVVYCWRSPGALEGMGLSLGPLTESKLSAVWQALQHGVSSLVERAMRKLCMNLITDHMLTSSEDPLAWWVTVLVRSAIEPCQGSDYIGRGRFLMNILPMDLDLHGRIEAIQHYATVFALTSVMTVWYPASDEWRLEVEQDLAMAKLDWLDEDPCQRPSDDEDPRDCSSPAWRSVLDALKHSSMVLLSRRKDIDTVLGEVQKLLSRDG